MIKISCPGCGMKIEYNTNLQEEIEVLTYPTISEIGVQDKDEFIHWQEEKQKKRCSVCGIEYSRKQYSECPLCKEQRNVIQLNQVLKEKESEFKRREIKLQQNINELTNSNKRYKDTMQQSHNKQRSDNTDRDKVNNSGKVNSTVSNTSNRTVVTMGKYNGIPINWFVICRDRMNKKALLISEKALGMVRYYSMIGISVSWENSGIRKWLNEDFMDGTFNDVERKNILLSDINNQSSEYSWNTPKSITKDKLFCLSVDEVAGYFPTAGSRKALDMNGKQTMWWLRGLEVGHENAPVVCADGEINQIGYNVTSKCYVRPAMWIDLKYLEFIETLDEMNYRNFEGMRKDIFGNMDYQKKDKSIKGKNIYKTIQITADEAARGAQKIIEIPYEEYTKGFGIVKSIKKIQFKIPTGVKTGTSVRMQGRGGPGINGGDRGDLYVKLEIR